MELLSGANWHTHTLQMFQTIKIKIKSVSILHDRFSNPFNRRLSTGPA
jgi:hypothetical protein